MQALGQGDRPCGRAGACTCSQTQRGGVMSVQCVCYASASACTWAWTGPLRIVAGCWQREIPPDHSMYPAQRARTSGRRRCRQIQGCRRPLTCHHRCAAFLLGATTALQTVPRGAALTPLALCTRPLPPSRAPRVLASQLLVRADFCKCADPASRVRMATMPTDWNDEITHRQSRLLERPFCGFGSGIWAVRLHKDCGS